MNTFCAKWRIFSFFEQNFAPDKSVNSAILSVKCYLQNSCAHYIIYILFIMRNIVCA